MVYSKKIGITGASGFIGSHLSRILSKKYALILFDSKINPKMKEVHWNTKNLFECTKQDFQEIDILIHLAGTPTSKNAFEKNFLLTKHLLNKSIEAEVKEFYLASSYAVYGDRETPADTNDELNPLDEYSLSKLFAEYELKKLFLNEKIRGKIFRFCSIYGEGGRGLIDVLKNKIKNKREIFLDSVFERNYLDVEDLIKEIEKNLENNEEEFIVNFSGERLSTKDLNTLLKSKKVKCSLSEDKKPSFLCKGSNYFKKKVKEYLFN